MEDSWTKRWQNQMWGWAPARLHCLVDSLEKGRISGKVNVRGGQFQLGSIVVATTHQRARLFLVKLYQPQDGIFGHASDGVQYCGPGVEKVTEFPLMIRGRSLYCLL